MTKSLTEFEKLKFNILGGRANGLKVLIICIFKQNAGQLISVGPGNPSSDSN